MMAPDGPQLCSIIYDAYKAIHRHPNYMSRFFLIAPRVHTANLNKDDKNGHNFDEMNLDRGMSSNPSAYLWVMIGHDLL